MSNEPEAVRVEGGGVRVERMRLRVEHVDGDTVIRVEHVDQRDEAERPYRWL